MAIYSAQELLSKHNVTPDQVKSIAPIPQETTNNVDTMQNVKDFGIGVAKGIGETVNMAQGLNPVNQGLKTFGLQEDIIPQDMLKAENTAQTVGKGVELAAEALLPTGLAKSATKLGAKTAGNVTGKVAEQTKDIADNVIGFLADKVPNKSADPQLASSVERLVNNVNIKVVPESIKPEVEKLSTKLDTLIKQGKKEDAQKLIQSAPAETKKYFLNSAKRLPDPVKMYDDFLKQSKEAIIDTKVDPAISNVGSEIGSAFQKVIKQRRQVGSVMGAELKKFANATVNLKNPVSSFQKDLIDSGATYDVLSKEVAAGGTSKFTQTDLNLLQKYVDELDSLGKEPTAAELDAFISRLPREIKEIRSVSGVKTVTNAERIIKKNIEELRTSLKPVATKDYLKAKELYGDLSTFIESGASYLGKLTSSGDFARDASLAKSSVQSILNNGKKDWLIQLEKLTGEPLLDKSVLALQAMKDAGDFRGISLLETLADGSLPTKAGISQKVFDYVAGKANEAVIGKPEEQTRRFLENLIKKKGPQTSKDAYGAVAGVEVDEDGNVSFNPVSGAAGMAGVGVAGTLGKSKKINVKTIAKNMDKKDRDIIANYLDNPEDVKSFMKAKPLLDAMKVPDNASFGQIEQFLAKVMEHYNG